MKFLRTIRLDSSDTRVFEIAATPGELAVPGSFTFLEARPENLNEKQLQAFRNGFLGVESFGWSTLAQIVVISEDELQKTISLLARHFVERFGAPNIDAAIPAAREEADYTVSVCTHKPNTLLVMEREFNEEGIIENLRVIQPNAADHNKFKLWGFDKEE